MLEFLNDLHRAEATVSKLETRLAAERAAVDAQAARYRAALLAIEDEEPGADAKSVDVARKAMADAKAAVEKTEFALAAASERVIALRKNDEASMSAKAKAARASARKEIESLGQERERLAHAIKTSLVRFHDDRQQFAAASQKLIAMGASLGVTFEHRAAGLDAAVFDGFVNHLFGELKLPHGTAWSDPTAPRPNLTNYVASASKAIAAAIGAGHD